MGTKSFTIRLVKKYNTGYNTSGRAEMFSFTGKHAGFTDLSYVSFSPELIYLFDATFTDLCPCSLAPLCCSLLQDTNLF